MNKTNFFPLVVGLGKTGQSLARYLRRKNINFVMYDTRIEPVGLNEFRQEFPGIDVFSGDMPDSLLDRVSEIITSPGVDLDAPVMKKAREKNILIYGDIECFARELALSPKLIPVIAITGTNGKSTVTTLVGEMARAAGKSVAVAGNIGVPVLDLFGDGTQYEMWVLELSSFQLDLTTSLTPTVATILNLSPDHLDRHHSTQSYFGAKQRVYHHAKTMLYNRDDEQTMPSESVVAHVINYGLGSPDEDQWGLLIESGQLFLAYGRQKICSVDDLKIKGRHNWANALAACALAHEAGISVGCMIRVLKQFTGLPHRTQWVRTLNGIDWIDDSKGTNIGATSSAILGIGEAMQGKIVLIAGGQGKGADFSELSAPMADHVRSLVLIGEDADKIEMALASVVDVHRARTLEEAVRIAHQQAKFGDVVMLSPACASLDMFRDYNHRGDVFTSAVNAL